MTPLSAEERKELCRKARGHANWIIEKGDDVRAVELLRALASECERLEEIIIELLPIAEQVNDVEPVGGSDENCGVNRANIIIENARSAVAQEKDAP